MTQNLADYFVISGLSISSGLEPDQLSGDNFCCPPLERPYKAKVLAYYPENVDGNPFDKDAVCMLCHPRGLKFATQRNSRPTTFHSFLITKEDGSRNYGSALTFYEKVTDPQICGAMQTLQHMHMAELSTALVAHGIRQPAAKQSSRSFTKPSQPYHFQQDTLYVTHCICLISVLPFIGTFERFLRALHPVAVNSTIQVSEMAPESYVYNILHEVTLPPAGSSLKLSIPGGQVVVCQRPGLTELPLLDYPLKHMFNILGVDNALGIFTSMLLEYQVLLYSTDYQKLMLVAESLTALMFPFQWQHVYVPILPASLAHFLDAPVPFIMGLHHCSDEEALASLYSKANMCFVNIDACSVEVPEYLPEFPFRSQLASDVSHWLKSPVPAQLTADLTFFSSDNGNQRDSGFTDSFVGNEGPPDDSNQSGSLWSLPTSHMEILHQSEALAKVTALARKTGVISSVDDIRESLRSSMEGSRAQSKLKTARLDAHSKELLLNSSVRELFLHYFLQIFKDYESFVIQPSHDMSMDMWISNRESMQNFDKTAFLGDQPEGHLPFLSAFIETQMFATFIDNKIMALWEEAEVNLKVFDMRLQHFKDEFGDRRVKNYNRNSMAVENEALIQGRAAAATEFAPLPRPCTVETGTDRPADTFPILSSQVLNKKPQSNRSNDQGTTAVYTSNSKSSGSVHMQMHLDQKEKYLTDNRVSKGNNPKLADLNPAHMTQTNWKFVEQLLKEAKAKTKRILVEKMGQEAFDLGHRESIHLGVEENTLIASLCDLLERIWSHGLQNKQGKSAFWWHLLNFQEEDHYKSRGGVSTRPNDPALKSPDLRDVTDTFSSGSDDDSISGTQTWPVRRHKRHQSREKDANLLPVVTVSLVSDMKNIQQITDLRTDVGCARAWVRLALEKKLLSTHLKELLSNAAILKKLYKRYAFLRCEDEREQFLYHLLSLNAVDFLCFTNTFTNITIQYTVLLFPRLKAGGSNSTANCWFSLAGQLRETTQVLIPKNTLEIPLQHKSLGALTTMRIGHDNAGMSPKWLIDYVVVRNEVNGHTYRFPCGRWLGRGVDDGALERLLIAELLPPSTDANELTEKCRTPPRCRSPSMGRKSSEARLQVSEIQTTLGDAINNLVKHFYRPEKERGNMTPLLCGEFGLVYGLEQVFEFGFKSSRVFRSRMFVWDFLEKVQEYFENLMQHEQFDIRGDIRQIILTYCFTVARINQASDTVGKDERFQIFICVGLRDHLLQKWIRVISKNPVCTGMYEEKSFLRDPTLLQHIIQLLDSLNDFEIKLEKSLVKGVSL